MHLEIYLCSVINGTVGVVLSKNNNFQKNNTIRKPPSKKLFTKFLPFTFVFLIPCNHPFPVPIRHKVKINLSNHV